MRATVLSRLIDLNDEISNSTSRGPVVFVVLRVEFADGSTCDAAANSAQQKVLANALES